MVQVANLHGDLSMSGTRGRTLHSNLAPVDRLFTDRESSRARVRRLVHERSAEDGTTLVKLHGAPGVGTSELARQLATELADHYPDAGLEIDLGGPDPARAVPGEALLDRLLLLCGARTEEIPGTPAAKRDLFLRLTAGRTFVLVLDNAVGAGQVRALLPGRSRCLLLVTSLEALPRVGNVGKELPVHVGELEDEAVAEILRKGLPEDALEGVLEGTFDRLVGLCHGLPVLARLAIAYLDQRPFSGLEDLITHLEEGGGEHPRDRIAAHVAALTEPAGRVFRAVGAHAALGTTIDLRSLQSVLGDPAGMREGLNELATHSLARRVGSRRSVWLTVGSLVGSVAEERAGAEHVRRERLGALCSFYRDAAVRAASLLTRRPLLGAVPDADTGPVGADEVVEARNWLHTAADVLAAVVGESGAAGDHRTVIATAEAATVYLAEAGRTSERTALLRQGHEAAVAAGDTRARIRFGNLLGVAHLDRGAFDEAEAVVAHSLELAEPAGDTMELAASHEVLGIVAQRRGDHTRAVERLSHVRQLKEELHRPQALAVADLLIARSQIALGRCAEARERLEGALSVFAEPGQHRAPDAVNVAKVRSELGRALCVLGETEAAGVELREALKGFVERDMPLQRAHTLETLAATVRDAQVRDEHLTAAAGLYRDAGNVSEAERVESEREGPGPRP
ncbi:hypothetical protein GCM10007147_33820 [Nocardiopsis kunsanensis]|uniref:NB-ARC domain-containing protein n=1 Tax=Nocardiopsis kunsanensis TaxID=141693 RepID=A0A919CJG6_9ACTN|nr:hypothetical protein GCM10007147_33820 [Nocardiopsis kunsanensis]